MGNHQVKLKKYKKKGGTLSENDKAEVILLINSVIDTRMGSSSTTASATASATEIVDFKVTNFNITGYTLSEDMNTNIVKLISKKEDPDELFNIIERLTNVKRLEFLNFFRKSVIGNLTFTVTDPIIKQITIFFIEFLKDYLLKSDTVEGRASQTLKSTYRNLLKNALSKYFSKSIIFIETD